MPTPRTTAGTTIGSRNMVRSRPAIGNAPLRIPREASVPSTVASTVAPLPMMRLLTMDVRHTSAVVSSCIQRIE